jgi:hypothetical protein
MSTQIGQNKCFMFKSDPNFLPRSRPQTGIKLTIEASDQKTLIDVLACLARIGSDHEERRYESPPWMDLPPPDI